MSAIPIIICGKTVKIASAVKAGLAPEYSRRFLFLSNLSGQLDAQRSPLVTFLHVVQHLILSTEAGISELPQILSGQTPPPPKVAEDQIGTQDYSTPPQAIVLGGGYDSEDLAKLRKACEGAKFTVPWLEADKTVVTPPVGPAYGAHILERTKACLNKLQKEGKLGKVDGVFLF